MTQDLADNFWGEWYKAGELERLKLVETLTGFKDNYGQASLLNSYLSDLAEYLQGMLN